MTGNRPLTAAEHEAAVRDYINRGGLPISIYPPREITEDLQHVKLFTTGDTIKTMSALAKNLGLSLNQIGRLCFEIGLAVAPTLMAMQKHHEDTMGRAIIEAKREHGQKVRRDVVSGKYGQRLRAERETRAAKAKKATAKAKPKPAKRR